MITKNLPSEMAYRGQFAGEGAAWRPRSEAQTCHRRWRIVENSMQAKAQFGARCSQSDEPRLWQVISGRDMPPLIHTMRHFLRQVQFFFGGADFFSAKRLFLRAARDVSGAHSEPPWARVEIKLKMSFQALSHSPSHERALALTSPPSRLFVLFHPSKPHQPPIPQPHHPKNSNIPYWYCPL